MNNHLLMPIWKGNIVYDESVLPLENKDGSLDDISMLYYIDKIISVKSSDFKTEYVKDIDYELIDGRLRIIPTGSIPVMKYEEYFFDKEIPGRCFPATKGGYIYWTEDGDCHKRQIVVSYEHSDDFQGLVPDNQSEKLSHSINLIKEGKEANVLFYGDSITEGANASSTINKEPYLERWTRLVVNELQQKFNNKNIIHINTALGGMTSTWGSENAYERVAKHKPDLLCLGFGMNDGHMANSEYADNIKSIIDTTRASNPNCDIILVATTLPNKETKGFFKNQINFIDEINKIANENDNIAVADMTSMHKFLLSKKRFFDMTGNNVNHPNDYLVRVYAQVILKVLGVE